MIDRQQSELLQAALQCGHEWFEVTQNEWKLKTSRAIQGAPHLAKQLVKLGMLEARVAAFTSKDKRKVYRVSELGRSALLE
jgi:hypothetical protein